MQNVLDEMGSARAFQARLREIGAHGQDWARSRVQACNAPELDAWARYGLTHGDGVLGSDDAAWAARLAAVEALDAYRWAVGAAQRRTAASADTGSIKNCAWMDNATLAGALALVLGRTDAVASTTLIDLETFVRAAVLYDHVFCLPPQGDIGLSELNECLHDRVVVPLPVEEADLIASGSRPTPLGAVLYGLHQQATAWTHRYFETPVKTELWEAMLDKWEHVLGWRPETDQLDRAVDTAIPTDVLPLNRALLAVPDAFGQEARLSGAAPTRRDREVYWLITVSAARALFNGELAATLHLPYLGNVARIPFRQALVARQRAAMGYVASPALHDVLDDSVRTAVAQIPGGATLLPLPTFTAALFARVHRSADLPDALAELRGNMAPLRARRDELQAALDDPTTMPATRHRLNEAVTAEARKLSALEAGGILGGCGTIYVSAAFSSPAPTQVLTMFGLLQLAAAVKPVAEALIPRLRRPYEHLLTDLQPLARGTVEAVPQLQRLGYRPYSGDWNRLADGLNRLGGLRVA
jgi:hypothetical protein